jgi:hypothetical protein
VVADEELLVEETLEVFHLLADGRGRYPQLAGGWDKAPGARRGLEGLEGVQGGQFPGQAGDPPERSQGKKFYAILANFYVEEKISWR